MKMVDFIKSFLMNKSCLTYTKVTWGTNKLIIISSAAYSGRLVKADEVKLVQYCHHLPHKI